ncbi:lipocalin-like domain-containing protein [Dyadobacter luticola]|uniref:Lipocalin family protein n=1 Tax=Dyadobacter luticola TaxID=1979387 RepID=A0A5R9KXI1_9BACT|nr:lipocalin family protein [Dyadobacter luticola]TLV00871.1 lipocalin family protein [Dyadobacter luticola]
MKKSPLKSLTNYLLMFALVAGIFACSKDSDDPTPQPDSVEGKWKISAITVDPAQNGITDFLAFLEAATGNKCLSSIVFDFKSNGTIDGTVPAGCTDEGDDIVDDKSTWKVIGNKIQLTDGTDVSEYDLTVTKTEMRWSQMQTDNGVSYKLTLVFKKP